MNFLLFVEKEGQRRPSSPQLSWGHRSVVLLHLVYESKGSNIHKGVSRGGWGATGRFEEWETVLATRFDIPPSRLSGMAQISTARSLAE